MHKPHGRFGDTYALQWRAWVSPKTPEAWNSDLLGIPKLWIPKLRFLAFHFRQFASGGLVGTHRIHSNLRAGPCRDDVEPSAAPSTNSRRACRDTRGLPRGKWDAARSHVERSPVSLWRPSSLILFLCLYSHSKSHVEERETFSRSPWTLLTLS